MPLCSSVLEASFTVKIWFLWNVSSKMRFLKLGQKSETVVLFQLHFHSWAVSVSSLMKVGQLNDVPFLVSIDVDCSWRNEWDSRFWWRRFHFLLFCNKECKRQLEPEPLDCVTRTSSWRADKFKTGFCRPSHLNCFATSSPWLATQPLATQIEACFRTGFVFDLGKRLIDSVFTVDLGKWLIDSVLGTSHARIRSELCGHRATKPKWLVNGIVPKTMKANEISSCKRLVLLCDLARGKNRKETKSTRRRSHETEAGVSFSFTKQQRTVSDSQKA